MKAVIFNQIGGPEVLHIGEMPTPEPGPGQVLVKAAFAGIQFADIGRRTGLYRGVTLPFVPGLEGSGTVVKVGNGVTAIEIGANVLAWGVQGSYAEYFLAAEGKVATVPATIPLELAAGIPQIFMTAWNALMHRARLQAGETILVQSAGNGAGIAAVQIGRHIGARIIGTASNQAKMDAALEAGAHDVINYLDTDFESEVMRLTDRRGVDVCLDGVGGETFRKSVRCLAPNGRMLTIGHSGGDSTLGFGAFDLSRGAVIMGGAAGLQALPGSELQQVMALLEQGALRPVPTAVFPWTEAGAAQRSIEDRQAVGKVVLRIEA